MVNTMAGRGKNEISIPCGSMAVPWAEFELTLGCEKTIDDNTADLACVERCHRGCRR